MLVKKDKRISYASSNLTFNRDLCHVDCILFSRFNLLCALSNTGDVFNTFSHKVPDDSLNDEIIRVLKLQNVHITAQVIPNVRKQFRSLLYAHQTNIRRKNLKYFPNKWHDFNSQLKNQTSKVCLVGQVYSKYDVATYESNQLAIHDYQQRVRQLTVQVSQQKKRLKGLKIRNKSFFKQNSSPGQRRKSKCLAVKYLKETAAACSLELLNVTFKPTGTDASISHAYSRSAAVEQLSPVAASQAMDAIQLSMRKYKILHESHPEIFPSPHSVNKVRSKLADLCPVVETQLAGMSYAGCSYRDLLTLKIRSLIAAGSLPRDQNLSLKVKISGDGTWVGRHSHLVTLCFVVIVPGLTCQSANDVCTVVLANCKEEIDSLQTCFRTALEEIKNTKNITIDGSTHSLEYCFGADYKFELLSLGMKSASSNHPCIHCKKAKSKFFESTTSDTETEDLSRTIDNMGSAAEGVSDRGKLVDFIELKNYLVDVLHLKLRIMDQIFKFVITTASTLDATTQINKRGKKATKMQSNLSILEKYLESIRIHWHYVLDSKTNTPVISLRGTDYDNFLENFDVRIGCPNFKESQSRPLEDTLHYFGTILRILRKLEITSVDIFQMRMVVDQWFQSIRKLVVSNAVTPYMHLLNEHVIPMLETHGSIFPFANEGVEQYNNLATKRFQNQTNHKKGALRQIMNTSNRATICSVTTRKTLRSKPNRCTRCLNFGHKKTTCLNNENADPEEQVDSLANQLI